MAIPEQAECLLLAVCGSALSGRDGHELLVGVHVRGNKTLGIVMGLVGFLVFMGIVALVISYGGWFDKPEGRDVWP